MRLLYSFLLVAGLTLAKKPARWQEDAAEQSTDASLRGIPGGVPADVAAKLEKRLESMEATYESVRAGLAARSEESHKHSLVAAAKIHEKRMKERATNKDEKAFSLAEVQQKRNKLRSDLLAKRKEARQSKAKGDVQSATIMYDDDDETYTQTNLEVWTYFSNHRFIHAGTGMYGESMNIESVGDSTPASYSNDMRNWDFHAFEVDPNHGPVYVRGTYGHFGYFEGEVYQDYEDHSKLHAFVKWMEADDRPGVHATLSGGAVLKYDMEYGDVHGERWRSDSHAGPWYENSVDYWEGWAGVPVDYLGMDHYETAKVLCFYDHHNPHTGDVSNPRGFVYQAFNDRGMTAFIPTDVGSPIGGVLGGYVYKYSPKECRQFPELCAQYNRIETGEYGNDLLVNFQSSAVVASGFWHAHTGPKGGQVGTVLYGMMEFHDDESGHDYSLILGFNCDPIEYPDDDAYYNDYYYGGDLGDGECYFEGYWRHYMKDRPTFDHLMALNRGNVRGLKRAFKSVYGLK